jgi:putative membrane protein
MLLPASNRHIALVLWSTPRMVPIAALAAVAVGLDAQLDLHVSVLAVPTSALGTAIALFLGFKNNQAYDRFWEARKIWGAIVNASRTFAVCVTDFVRPPAGTDPEATSGIQRELVLRHLAWINALRLALRRQPDQEELAQYLGADELEALRGVANVPHAILRTQSRRIEELCESGHVVGTARHLELRTLVRFLWDHQGGCERIKNTPLVPHYTTAATVFTWIFITLFPFSILDVFEGRDVWWVIVVSTLVGWVYDTTNRLGQLTADPFDRLPTDVPMTALCRTIEIDLRTLLGDERPEPLKPTGLVLD